MKTGYFEIPPTAGLPLEWKDWFQASSLDLEAQISQQYALPPLQLTCSGTAALIIALTALAKKYPSKKQVIIPAYTCPLVALAIYHCKLQILLCDLAPADFNLDTEHLASLLNEKVLAIVPTHLSGQVADIQKIRPLIEPYGTFIIEDAAQALGAAVGYQGDVVFFSLAAGKGLTLYEGGLLTSRHENLREAFEETRQQLLDDNVLWAVRRTLQLLGYTLLYQPFGLQFAYGMPKRWALNHHRPLDAVGDVFDLAIPLHRVNRLRQRVGSHCFARFPHFLLQTTRQAEKRVKILEQIEDISVVRSQEDTASVWPFFMVLAPTAQIKQAILEELWPSPLGVSCLFLYALPDYEYLQAVVPRQSLPHAQDFAARMFTITNSLWLNDQQFDSIVQTIRRVINVHSFSSKT